MQRAAQRIVEKLRAHGHEAFFAGGWVRDFLLRRKPKDIDIATSAQPDQVIRLFPKSLAIGAQFGVIKVLMYGHHYEVATFRSDNPYLDGRHPSSVEFSGPEQDAYRRDFTINGLFYDPLVDRLIDYVHGKADIQNRLIRTIGIPKDRFTEDKLRMMRAIRLACSLNFEIVPETWEAIRHLSPEILQISWERIRDELLKILIGPSPARGLDLLHESGILVHILPEVGPGRASGTDRLNSAKSALGALHKPSAIVALSALLQGTGKSGEAADGGATARLICRRLRMSNEETDRIVDLITSQGSFSHAKDLREADLKRLLKKPNIHDHLELHRANCISSRIAFENYWFCLEKLDEFSSSPVAAPLLRGEDLIEMGYEPGPIFKEILRTIEDLQLEGAIQTREEAMERIRRSFPLTDKIHH
jgi:tRNA nucleotidyltransferase/poly(A) polymerase